MHRGLEMDYNYQCDSARGTCTLVMFMCHQFCCKCTCSCAVAEIKSAYKCSVGVVSTCTCITL